MTVHVTLVFCCWTKIWLLSWEWDNHAWWETCIYEIMTTIFFKDFVRQILEGKNQQLPPNLTTESKMIRGLFEFNLTGVSGIPKHFCHIGYNPSFEGCDSDLFGVFKLKLILQIDFFKHILSFKFVQCFTNQPFVPADCDARFFWGWKIPTKRGRWKTWMMPCKWSVALGIFMGPSYQWRKGRGYAANRDLWDLIFLKLLWVIWVDCHLVRNQAFKDIKLRSDKTVRVQRPGIGNMVSFPEIAGHSCRFLKKHELQNNVQVWFYYGKYREALRVDLPWKRHKQTLAGGRLNHRRKQMYKAWAWPSPQTHLWQNISKKRISCLFR